MDSTNLHNISQSIFAGLTIYAAYIIALCTYRIFFHPLAKFPGPLLGNITEWNTIWPSLRGDATFTRYGWLKKYGQVVRVGPNEIMFGDISSVKDIYGQNSNPCLKDPVFYNSFTCTGVPNVLNMVDRGEHARVRRLQSHAFSLNEVAKNEAQIVGVIKNCMDKMVSGSQPVNMYSMMNYHYADIVSKLSFGHSLGCLDGQGTQEAEDADNFPTVPALKGFFPWIEYVPFEIIRASLRGRPRLVKCAKNGIADFRANLEAGKEIHSALLQKLLEVRDEESGQTFTEEELVENAIQFIVAGSGTTMTTSLYFFYEVATHPRVEEKLQCEIRKAFPDRGILPTFEKLAKVPYLNMVWNEILRLRGPLPVHSPRISPGKVIGGHYIPKGIRVGNLIYATHMNPEIFPDPHDFIPERWAMPTADMKLAFRPFSSGPRNCIGMHLAKVQGLLTLGCIYQSYDLTLDQSMTPEMMIPSDYGVMSPRAKSVLFHVKKAGI